MEKLEHVDMNCVNELECVEFKVCVDNVDTEPKNLIQVRDHKNPVKSQLSKLFKKSKLNVNYIKETNPIENLKFKQNSRIYSIF
ncbi:MAG: hypothetical protein ACFFG0_40420 [Candidatus Thorarchaeota archaeon]